MKDELICLEVAKLAKEKGFNIDCDWKIDDEQKFHFQTDLMCPNNSEFTFNPYDDPEVHHFNKFIESLYEAPTQSLLQRWLRETHNIYVESYHDLTSDGKRIQFYTSFGFFQQKDINGVQNVNGWYDEYNDWKTYEEALETGLLEGLKSIKI